MTTSQGHISRKASRFTESVIREMTREAMQHGAINLAQGFPDFPAPEEIKQAAIRAIEADVNPGDAPFITSDDVHDYLVHKLGVDLQTAELLAYL